MSLKNIFLENYTLLLGNLSVGTLCGVIGYFLLIKKMSSLADGLAHSFFGINAMCILTGLDPSVIFFFLLPVLYIFLKRNSKSTYRDPIITAVSIFFMALGAFIYNIKPQIKEKIIKSFFGNIMEIKPFESWILFFLLLVVIFLIWIKYNYLLAYIFSEKFIFPLSKKKIIETTFISFSTIVISVCIKYCGSLLIMGITIFPGMLSQMIVKNFKQGLFFSFFFSMIISFISYCCGIYFNLTPSIINILCSSIIFFIFNIFYKK